MNPETKIGTYEYSEVVEYAVRHGMAIEEATRAMMKRNLEVEDVGSKYKDY